MIKTISVIFKFIILIVLQFIIPKYVLFADIIYPNFILIYIVYSGLNKGSVYGEFTGFFYGFIWDILSTDIFGIRTLTFTISGYLAGRFRKDLNKSQPLTQIIVMFIALIITNFGTSAIYLIVPTEIVYPYFEITYRTWLLMAVNLILTPITFKLLFITDQKTLKTSD